MLEITEIVRRLNLSNKKMVATKAGVHPNIVYRIASGETENPRHDTLKKISDALEGHRS